MLDLDGASDAGLIPLVLNKEDSPLLERLQHALLEAVADDPDPDVRKNVRWALQQIAARAAANG